VAIKFKKRWKELRRKKGKKEKGHPSQFVRTRQLPEIRFDVVRGIRGVQAVSWAEKKKKRAGRLSPRHEQGSKKGESLKQFRRSEHPLEKIISLTLVKGGPWGGLESAGGPGAKKEKRLQTKSRIPARGGRPEKSCLFSQKGKKGGICRTIPCFAFEKKMSPGGKGLISPRIGLLCFGEGG